MFHLIRSWIRGEITCIPTYDIFTVAPVLCGYTVCLYLFVCASGCECVPSARLVDKLYSKIQ